MFEWIWNRLPGSTWVRAVTALLIVLAVVALLFLVVFPWLTPLLPFTDTTVDTGGPAPTQ